MLDGRVKTLHPKIHGGMLARRDRADAHGGDRAGAASTPIDLVVVNLYPFRADRREARLHARGRDREHRHRRPGDGARARRRTTRASRWSPIPADYACMLDELRANDGALSAATRFALAKKAFAHTAAYDGAIANYLTVARRGQAAPAHSPTGSRCSSRRCRSCATARTRTSARPSTATPTPVPGALARYAQLQGKELSYNNIADADAAWECVKTFAAAGLRDRQARQSLRRRGWRDAAARPTERAFATDPTSAFGGIIAFNRALDGAAAEAVAKQFVEVVIAPSVDAGARAVFAAKQNVRVLEVAAGARRAAATTSSASAAACWCRRRTRATWRPTNCASSPGARRRPQQMRRPAVRLARGQVREVERHRLLRRRQNARRRRRPDEPRRQRPHRRRSRRRTPASRWPARWSPPTRSSRSATGSTWWRRRARRRSSSPAAACATTK